MCESDRIYKKIYYYYPPIDMSQEVMPTRLGNVMKSAEMYTKQKYNADAVFFLSKLYHAMSSDWIATLTNARGSLDMMILISFLSFILSICGSIFLLLSGAQPLHFLGVFWIFLVIGWLAYYGAITYAVTYGDMIRSTFDLYRDKLISEMGLKQPESPDAEKEFWNELELWLRLDKEPRKIKYSKSSKETSK